MQLHCYFVRFRAWYREDSSVHSTIFQRHAPLTSPLEYCELRSDVLKHAVVKYPQEMKMVEAPAEEVDILAISYLGYHVAN